MLTHAPISRVSWRGKKRPVTGYIATFTIVLFVYANSCIAPFPVDPYWAFEDWEKGVRITDGEGAPTKQIHFSVGQDKGYANIIVRRAVNIDLREDESTIMIDLIIGPKKLGKKTRFFPDSIRFVVGGVSLIKQASKKDGCSWTFNVCIYRTTFYLDSVRIPPPLADTTQPWCIIDLRKALMLDSVPIDLGIRYGYLPFRE